MRARSCQVTPRARLSISLRSAISGSCAADRLVEDQGIVVIMRGRQTVCLHNCLKRVDLDTYGSGSCCSTRINGGASPAARQQAPAVSFIPIACAKQNHHDSSPNFENCGLRYDGRSQSINGQRPVTSLKLMLSQASQQRGSRPRSVRPIAPAPAAPARRHAPAKVILMVDPIPSVPVGPTINSVLGQRARSSHSFQ
jgi:hypothetical protein